MFIGTFNEKRLLREWIFLCGYRKMYVIEITALLLCFIIHAKTHGVFQVIQDLNQPFISFPFSTMEKPPLLLTQKLRF